MRMINELPNGSQHIAKLYDLIIYNNTEGSEKQLFIVMEYFPYDLKTLMDNHQLKKE